MYEQNDDISLDYHHFPSSSTDVASTPCLLLAISELILSASASVEISSILPFLTLFIVTPSSRYGGRVCMRRFGYSRFRFGFRPHRNLYGFRVFFQRASTRAREAVFVTRMPTQVGGELLEIRQLCPALVKGDDMRCERSSGRAARITVARPSACDPVVARTLVAIDSNRNLWARDTLEQ